MPIFTPRQARTQKAITLAAADEQLPDDDVLFVDCGGAARDARLPDAYHRDYPPRLAIEQKIANISDAAETISLYWRAANGEWADTTIDIAQNKEALLVYDNENGKWHALIGA